MESNNSSRRVSIGIIFIVLGLLFFLKQANIIQVSVSELIFTPATYMIIIGGVLLANSRKILFGVMLVIFGISIHLLHFVGRFIPAINTHEVIVGLGLLLFGAYILLKNYLGTRTIEKHGLPFTETNSDLDVIDDVAILGGGKRIMNTQNFRGGSIMAIMGGSEVDLRNCKLAPGNNILDIFIIMGGTEIKVPKNWIIHIDVIPIFGGFSQKKVVTGIDPLDVDAEGVLIIKGLVIFGGGEIKVSPLI